MDLRDLEKNIGDPNRVNLLYGEEIARCPELGTVLRELDATAAVRNQIRNVFGTEEPPALQMMLGKKVGTNVVTAEVVEQASVVDEAYCALKEQVHALLKELAST